MENGSCCTISVDGSIECDQLLRDPPASSSSSSTSSYRIYTTGSSIRAFHIQCLVKKYKSRIPKHEHINNFSRALQTRAGSLLLARSTTKRNGAESRFSRAHHTPKPRMLIELKTHSNNKKKTKWKSAIYSCLCTC